MRTDVHLKMMILRNELLSNKKSNFAIMGGWVQQRTMRNGGAVIANRGWQIPRCFRQRNRVVAAAKV